MPDPADFFDFIAKTIREVEQGIFTGDFSRASKANFALYGVGKRFDKERARGNPVAIHYSGEIGNIINYLNYAMRESNPEEVAHTIILARKELKYIRSHYRNFPLS